jgi:two-component system nitrogen regulation response regulator GlnG
MGIVGHSEPMQKVFKLIGQLSSSSATVLITGESGTGKELIARAIYHHSLRHDKPYLAINCAAIPENLLESELFGHEKGSFSGATAQRIGKFEQCNNGTIFLDEIGDMSPTTQTKILRVLQSGAFERVGGNQPIQVDVRIIAATNKSLEKAVSDREFREDLFYRLNVVRIHTPPLRDRKDDIPLLVDYFLKKYARQNKQAPKTISDTVMSIWESYHWPGNVRELENVIQRSLVMSKSPVITTEDIPAELVAASPTPVHFESTTPLPAPPPPVVDSTNQSIDFPSISRLLFQWARERKEFKIIPMVERELIIEALKETGGNQVQTAKLLGITRATLRKRIDKFKIQIGLRVS